MGPDRVRHGTPCTAPSGQKQDVAQTEARLGAFHFPEVISHVPANPAENEAREPLWDGHGPFHHD